MRRCWSFGALVFLGIWLVLMLTGRTALFQDPGTFWHTRLGLETLASGQVTRVDAFTCSVAGQSWVDAQWLPECLMAAMYRLCGWDGLLLLTATLLAAIYAALAARLANQGWNCVAVLGLLALVLGASSHQFHVRPLVLTIGLLAGLQCVLVDVEAGRRGLKSLSVWIVIFLLWANSHGGVLAGLGTLSLTVVGWCGFRVLGLCSPVRTGREGLVSLAILAACIATVAVNPYGLSLARGWLHVLELPLSQIIQEHAPLDFGEPYAWIVLLLAALYVTALAGTPWRTWRVSWLLPLVWLGLTFLRVRNGALFAVTVAATMSDVLAQSRWAIVLRKHEWLTTIESHSGRRRFAPLLLPLAVVIVTAGLQAAGTRLPVVGQGWVQLDSQRWPVDLLPELRAIADRSDSPTPIVNDMLYGGFLIFHTPRLAVLIDDRCELFGRQMLLDYRRAETRQPERFDAWSRQYAARYALLPNDTPAERFFQARPDWHLIRRGAAAALYGR